MSKKQKTIHITAYTKGGLGSMLAFFKKHHECEVVKEPRERTDGSQCWEVVLTHPNDGVEYTTRFGWKYGE